MDLFVSLDLYTNTAITLSWQTYNRLTGG